MKDKIFKIGLWVIASITPLILAGIVFLLISRSLAAFQEFGFFHFLTSTEWDPREGNEQYGILSFIGGTLLTAFLALIIATPFVAALTLFNSELHKGTRLAFWTGNIIDLLAGIPAIIYGIWGAYLLRPMLISAGIGMQGYGIFTAALILAMMIIPYASSFSIRIVAMAPQSLKEAAFCLGATRLEVIEKITFPFVKKGIVAAMLLSLTKAMGESIAVTMVIGNNNQIISSITDSGNTLASILVNQIATGSSLKISSLIAVALTLFAITAIINAIARRLIRRIFPS